VPNVTRRKMTNFCDTPENMVEIKRGLGPKVKVSQPPADWVPDRVKAESTKPEFFVEIDNPANGDHTLSVLNFTRKQKERTLRRGSTPIMCYQLVQDQFQLTEKEKDRRQGGTFIIRDGRLLSLHLSEVAPHTKSPFLWLKRVISIMSC
jgi:hypothetical protein